MAKKPSLKFLLKTIGEIMKNLFTFTCLLALSSCSVTQLNDKIKSVSHMYSEEVRNLDPRVYRRSFAFSKTESFERAQSAVSELGFTITEVDKNKLIVEGIATGPTPFTKDEWIELGKIEKPKIKEVGGWMMTWPSDPSSGYDTMIIELIATTRELKDGSEVELKWKIDTPKYAEIGIDPIKKPPASAVTKGCKKFWAAFNREN